MEFLRTEPITALTVILLFGITVVPVNGSDLEPLKEKEMSSVVGKSNISSVIREARSYDELEFVFKDVSIVKSSERLKKRNVFSKFMVDNDLTRSLGHQIARAAIQNPVTATRFATSGTAREMTEIAAAATNIAQGLFGNVPTGNPGN